MTFRRIARVAGALAVAGAGWYLLNPERPARAQNRVIRPGSSSTSRMYLRISSSDFGQQVPPTGALSAEAIGTIKAWIDEGAVWPDAVAGDGAVSPP